MPRSPVPRDCRLGLARVAIPPRTLIPLISAGGTRAVALAPVASSDENPLVEQVRRGTGSTIPRPRARVCGAQSLSCESNVKTISIFNHVLGPVMRGPSSSHTAGAYHIACMVRSLLRAKPRSVTLAMDPTGSYAATFVPQGADRAFAMGLLNRPLTDASFFSAMEDVAAAGIAVRYEIRTLQRPTHPNAVEIEIAAHDAPSLRVEARSIGGGEVEITRLNDWPVLLNGSAYELVTTIATDSFESACEILNADGKLLEPPSQTPIEGRLLLCARRSEVLPAAPWTRLEALSRSRVILESAPVYYPHVGRAILASGADILDQTQSAGLSLGRLALQYESELLRMEPAAVLTEALRRFHIMEQAAERGLTKDFEGTQLLTPTAAHVFRAEEAGQVVFRSPHTRAAARAMAVMHVDSAMGVVCAAPTGGSAGVIPGALITLAEARQFDHERMGLALLASGLVGVIVAQRATFAAEVAGCQVEIGAAGAMAAAAVIDACGGSAQQALDAAAISFQNTMGLVCDLVQGMVEIPCTTRNAVAAANAFVNADLILGGYQNPIPLDQTIDAVLAVGRAMPKELLCTSQGGLAVTPAALAIKPQCCGRGCC